MRARAPREAQRFGIADGHQDYHLFPQQPVAENVALLAGKSDRSGPLLSRLALRCTASLLLRKYDVDVDPARAASSLSAAERKIVRVVDALALQPKYLILDEPTGDGTPRAALAVRADAPTSPREPGCHLRLAPAQRGGRVRRPGDGPAQRWPRRGAHPGRLVDGQIVGGFAQGVGAVLLESVVHDPAGRPLTTTYLGYLLPRSAEVPEVVLGHIEAPSPFVPGGMKGVGEGGEIAPPAAIANTIAHALPEAASRVTQIPLSPAVVWSLLHGVGQGA